MTVSEDAFAVAPERFEMPLVSDRPIRGFVNWPVVVGPVWIGQATSFYTDPQAAERRSVAKGFARVVRNIEGVREVWLSETMPELEVAILVRETDLDRELELRGIFIDLICDRLDPSVGELSIYRDSDVPQWVREGQRLT